MSTYKEPRFAVVNRLSGMLWAREFIRAGLEPLEKEYMLRRLNGEDVEEPELAECMRAALMHAEIDVADFVATHEITSTEMEEAKHMFDK